MIFILKLVLIILLNETYALITQENEIVLLPAWNPTGAKEISLTLKVFGKLIQLNLHKDDQFAPPVFKRWKYNTRSIIEKLSQLKASDSCFYIHENDVSFAAINICQKHGLVSTMEGVVFVENDILEIRSLWNMYAPLSFIDNFCVRQQINQSFGIPHLVKKSQQHFSSDLQSHEMRSKRSLIDEEQKKEQEERYTIELLVVVDVTAYRTFMSVFNNNISNIYDLIDRYVNQMQVFFYHPSLGVRVDIALANTILMYEELPNFSYSGRNQIMLDTFCSFVTLHTGNVATWDNHHWDIALFISGIDLWRPEKFMEKYFAERDLSIWGVTNPNEIEVPKTGIFSIGVCGRSLSCAMVEFLQHEVGSSGLKSSLNAVHKIGILLGLKEDLNKGSDSYVMSTKRPYQGDITWSPQSCSMAKRQLKSKLCLQDNRELINVEISKSEDWPIDFKRKQTAKAQCGFWHGEDANVVTLHDICKNLHCEMSHKNESHFAGCALNGSPCALGEKCNGGECVPVTEPLYTSKYCDSSIRMKGTKTLVTEGKKENSSKSNCLVKYKGIRVE